MKNLTTNLKLVRAVVLINQLDYCYFNRHYWDCGRIISLAISLLRSIRRDIVKEKNDWERSPVKGG